MGVAFWMMFAWIGMIPGWTVVVAILIGAAVLGWKVYESGNINLG